MAVPYIPNRAIDDDFGLFACGCYPVVAGAAVCRRRIPYVLGRRGTRYLAVRAKSVTVAERDSLVTLRSADRDMGHLKNIFNVRHRCIVRNCTGDRPWTDYNAHLG